MRDGALATGQAKPKRPGEATKNRTEEGKCGNID